MSRIIQISILCLTLVPTIFLGCGNSNTSSTTLIESTSTKPELANPTWDELVAFLRTDNTDSIRRAGLIHSSNSPTFKSSDYAKTLQSNAKSLGWRCAVVTVRLEGYQEYQDLQGDIKNLPLLYNSGTYCNAFETVDKGLIYVDVVGISEDEKDTSAFDSYDKIVTVEIGKIYRPEPLIPPSITPQASTSSGGHIVSSPYPFQYLSLGTVTDIDFQW